MHHCLMLAISSQRGRIPIRGGNPNWITPEHLKNRRSMRFGIAIVGLLMGSWVSAHPQSVSLIIPQQSAYGYHWTALAGSDRQLYVTPVAETDSITAWSGDGKVVTFTAANHLSANDLVNLRG